MKVRLFWTMLLAFILVIVLGICGMLGFFGLAIASALPQNTLEPWPGIARSETPGMPQPYAEALADYYATHGNSWAGLQQRLSAEPFGPPPFVGYTVIDDDRRVVASTNRAMRIGQIVDPAALAHGTPITVNSQRVGVLLIQYGRSDRWPGPPDQGPPFDFLRYVPRAFLLAGLGLTGILLVLAIIFARWFSRPLRGITQAAQALAKGQLDVRVSGARVRELDDLARAFNAMAQTLAQTDQQRRQMTADIAHELRTPLSVIKGRLEGLQDGVYQATPDQIQSLLDNTALLERLIEDLRLLALAEAGQLQLYTEEIDPRELLENTVDTFAEQAQTQQITFRIEAPDTLPPITIDPQRMAQVLSNLVANALRHTPANGMITLRAEPMHRLHPPRAPRVARPAARPAGTHQPALLRPTARTAPLREAQALDGSALPAEPAWVMLSVSDTGPGIAPADLPHIFDRFWRADRSRTRGSGGAGLGLAIARQIVAAHGGEIWAESKERQGTTISIALPTVGETSA